jgi:antibiotic biosynthesis monooxygenase (ABM) superfamily enzyme
MTTTQLRRYTIEPGRMDDFLAWWPSILGPREQYGFRVAFAHADDENNQFVWAVEHDGDFDSAEAVYMASPERAAAFESNPMVVTNHVVSKVRVVRP